MMKSKRMFAGVGVCVVFLLLAGVGFRTTQSVKTVKAASKKHVVTVDCHPTLPIPNVYVFTSGPGAYTSTFTDCAEVLSDYTTHGYSIDFTTIGHYGNTVYPTSLSTNIEYTLVAPESVWPWKNSTPSEVVILSCELVPPDDDLFFIPSSNTGGYDAYTSANVNGVILAPPVTNGGGTRCTPALSELTNVGFDLLSITPAEFYIGKGGDAVQSVPLADVFTFTRPSSRYATPTVQSSIDNQ